MHRVQKSFVYEKIIGDHSIGCLYGSRRICKSLHTQTTGRSKEDGEKGSKGKEGKEKIRMLALDLAREEIVTGYKDRDAFKPL